MDINKLTFTVSLSLDKVNLIIGSLAKQPFEQVADLINELRMTAVTTIQAAEAAENKPKQPAADPVPVPPIDPASLTDAAHADPAPENAAPAPYGSPDNPAPANG